MNVNYSNLLYLEEVDNLRLPFLIDLGSVTVDFFKMSFKKVYIGKTGFD